MIQKESILTPEVIEAIARHAGAINAAVAPPAVETASVASKKKPQPIDDIDCCSPKFIKFKFVLCDVEIKNVNAAAEEDKFPW